MNMSVSRGYSSNAASPVDKKVKTSPGNTEKESDGTPNQVATNIGKALAPPNYGLRNRIDNANSSSIGTFTGAAGGASAAQTAAGEAARAQALGSAIQQAGSAAADGLAQVGKALEKKMQQAKAGGKGGEGGPGKAGGAEGGGGDSVASAGQNASAQDVAKADDAQATQSSTSEQGSLDTPFDSGAIVASAETDNQDQHLNEAWQEHGAEDPNTTMDA